ncbi:hypothetical protein BIY24_03725 [Halobacteriovorax marinus]|uniref:hypothetical protein n=1 Tax=Halobacteriovorax marinus TaxID=97084 RepID=UPI000BC32DEB|nr:hypothetical protein [Halobacteriovorax marinus]ATH07075.1 hypothetical protein BIY24_03725 [Halobacteriovorax marinus]
MDLVKSDSSASDAVESLKNYNIVFYIGPHGIGKTHTLNSIIKDKDFKIEIYDFFDVSNLLQASLKIVSNHKKLVLLLLLTLFYSLTYISLFHFSKVIFDYIDNPSFFSMSFESFFSFLSIVFLLLFISDKPTLILKLSGKLKNKYIWIDDLERSSLSKTEKFSFIDKLSTLTKNNFLITIGYSNKEEEEEVNSILQKYKDSFEKDDFKIKIINHTASSEEKYLYIGTKLSIDSKELIFDHDKLLFYSWVPYFTFRDINEFQNKVTSLSKNLDPSKNENHYVTFCLIVFLTISKKLLAIKKINLSDYHNVISINTNIRVKSTLIHNNQPPSGGLKEIHTSDIGKILASLLASIRISAVTDGVSLKEALEEDDILTVSLKLTPNFKRKS